MKHLFSIQDNAFLSPVDKTEKVLQDLLWDKREKVFQKYNFIFIAKEYALNEGPVHDSAKTGRIDILAYDTAKERFVIFELKKDDGKHRGLYQAQSYRNYIKKHFAEVCLNVLKKYKVSIPKRAKNNKAEIILIAKEFTETVIDAAEEKENQVTLIEYNWLGNDFLLLDYVHDACDIKKKLGIPGGKKLPKWTQDIDKVWDKIKYRSDKFILLPMCGKGKIKKDKSAERIQKDKDFKTIVDECYTEKDAQRLFDVAAKTRKPKRTFYENLAKIILDLQKNLK